MARITQSTNYPTQPATLCRKLPARQFATRWTLAAALLATLFSVSLQSFAQSCTNLCLKQVSCTTGGATTSISGTVYTPNGKDPLPNVVVYVPNAAVAAFTHGVACVTSTQPVSGSPLVGTTTAMDGTYTLTNMPVGTNIPVVIQAGRWRRQYTVDTSAASCKNTLLNMNFPTQQSEGDIPLIAVASGSVDATECVLRKVGIQDKEFTIPTASGGTGRIQLYYGSSSPGILRDFNGVTLPNQTVLDGYNTAGASALSNYDMILFPCQGTYSGQANTASYANLLSYANAGGRIFTTHWSKVWLDNSAAFSGTVNWATLLTSSPTLTAGLTTSTNATIATQNSNGTTFTDGQTLTNWLQTIGATTTKGRIYVDTPHQDVSSVNSPTQTWITYSGTQTAAVGAVMQLTFDTPVSSTASNQCGRVLYNDYHVETPNSSSTYTGTFPTECYASGTTTTGAMTAQEKLLEYSLFDLSTFIVSQTPPTITAALSTSPTDFYQGDTADTITIHVTNASTTSPANPSLSFTVTLPAGVTATSMQDATGTGGWLCTASTLICTRISGLDANTSDNVTLIVSVSPTAPAGLVTASAIVTGGGLTADVPASVSFRIYGVPIITWPAPAAITYGPALSGIQLNATANVPGGPFVYTPPAGTILDAGTYTLSTVFTATDTVNYPKSATATVPFTVNQIVQVITFAPLTSPVTYGVAPMTLSATGGASGNPIIFTVTWPGTLTGNTLTITSPGTVTVTATQAGSTNYSAAAPVTQTIIVNQIAQTITFAPLASPVTYGVAPMTVSATGGASGNPVIFTITGPATLTGSTLTITGAGTVTITASQAGNTNYSAAPSVSQTLVVNPAAQTITFAPLATPVNYGVTPMTLSATGGASGNPVTFKVISGSATVSGNILTITGAGIVTVAADQAGNANYAAATEVTQTVTVNKIAPAITITSTPTPVFLFNPITLTANIPPPSTNSCLLCSVPTGTVTFLAGSTPLGTATLSGRNAVLTTSLAAVGTYTITAVYNGDSNFSTQTSAPVTEVAVDFTLTGSSTPSQDVLHGTAATYSFVITPVGSSTIPADIKLTLTGFPGASIVTFTPSTMVSASGTTNIVLTVQVPSYPTEAANTNHVPQRALALIALGSLLLPFGRKLRVGSKRAGRFLCLMLLLAGMGAMAGLTGCGAGWNHEDFTPTVTATSGALSHNTEISLRVH